jgi:preprotein translocase subunit YajC
MKVPDYISPVVAYRAWQLDATGLKSLCGELWRPGRSLAAACNASVRGTAHDVHDAPQMNCTCGIYAAKTFPDLRRAGYAGYGIHGEVYLWGIVVEHELGWRAQYACPKNFFLPMETLPVSMSMLEPRLKTLVAFGCDIQLISREGSMPLWLRDSGFEAATLDMLVQRCKSWYANRQQERHIKRGDRVAIIGRGIALVEHVNDRHVHVRLWNRNVLRISRKEILWDEGNARWETDNG